MSTLLKTVTILFVLPFGLYACYRVINPDNANAPLFGSGDPGGRILAQLRPLGSVSPQNARLVSIRAFEPHWVPDSRACDGHGGWSTIGVDVRFRVAEGTIREMLRSLTRHLFIRGWTPSWRGGWISWTRSLRIGGIAEVNLLSPPNPAPRRIPLARAAHGLWLLTAFALPTGRQAWSC